MALKPVQTKNLVQVVVEAIIDQINNGDLKPGDKLDSIRKLSEILNVGIGTVREAVRSLYFTKILDIIPGKGVYVSNHNFKSLLNPIKFFFEIKDIKRVEELYRIRESLEVLAIQDFFKKDLAGLDDLIKIYKSMSIAFNNNQYEQYIELDYKFHIMLLELSKNEMLNDLYLFLYKILIDVIKNSINNKEDLLQGFNDHEMLIKSLKNKDLPGSIAAMSSHIGHALDIIRRDFN